MMRGMHGMHGMHEGYGYGSIFMIVFWVVLTLLVIGLTIFLLINLLNRNKNKPNNNINNNQVYTPLITLQDRLVKGEIDEEEYERLKAIIDRDKE